jgi:DNA polymerase elongation subunit (family B)
MRTLIFDIKTVGEEWNDLDEATQLALTAWIPKVTKNDSEQVSRLEQVKDHLRWSPLTGKMVSLGLYDYERAEGAVYYTGLGNKPDEVVGEYILKPRSEASLLTEFWDGAREYDTFVTFNGRGFDVPFLLHRSVVCQVMPSCDLMERRYLYQQKKVSHVDLQDQLTFYGAMSKRPSLHLFCRAYGIESPKPEALSSGDIAVLYKEKKFRDSALYTVQEIKATTELYRKWLLYLAPASFKEREIDF